jgi:hypothetical protein
LQKEYTSTQRCPSLSPTGEELVYGEFNFTEYPLHAAQFTLDVSYLMLPLDLGLKISKHSLVIKTFGSRDTGDM